MGGGGGGRSGIGDVQSLIDKAKSELRKGDGTGKRNVFISFAMEDKPTVDLLRGQAGNDFSDIEFNDWSVSQPFNSDRAEYIKKKISERIERSSVSVVFMSDNAAKSKWVNWEIEQSVKLGKTVIGVHPKGKKPATLPKAAAKHAVKVVQWSKLASELDKAK